MHFMIEFLEILRNAIAIMTCAGGVVLCGLLIYISIRPRTPAPPPEKFPSMAILIPCHNEEGSIGRCIESVLKADYPASKKIIVINDASADRSSSEIERYASAVQVLTNPVQIGKARSLNRALDLLDSGNSELVAILDGDTFVGPEALRELAACFDAPDVGVATSVIRVCNRQHFLCWFFYFDNLFFSLLRELFASINANIFAPGQLATYRFEAIRGVGGFRSQGLNEDTDITLRIVISGFRSVFCREAWIETLMPFRLAEIIPQRLRWAKGNIFILKSYLRPGRHVVQWLTLPLSMTWWLLSPFVALACVIPSIYNIHVFLKWGALKIFMVCFTCSGFIQMVYETVRAGKPIPAVVAIGLISGLSYFIFNICAAFRYKKTSVLHVLVPLFFLPLYIYVFSIIPVLALPALFRKRQDNIWTKTSVQKLAA